jgi:uncharacterized protein YeaO (DUF488 family)
MSIVIKRAYELPAAADGYRILVDRLWPRGLTKAELELDEWLKEIAPSGQLRRAFHAGEITWTEFRNRYLAELKQHRDELRRLVGISQKGRITLVFSAKDPERNNALVLMEYLRSLGDD